MKTIKINSTKVIQEKTTEVIEVIDRDYYISKIKEQEKESGQLVVEIYGGALTELHNCPNKTYTLIDWDDLKAMSEEEFKEWVKANKCGDAQ